MNFPKINHSHLTNIYGNIKYGLNVMIGPFVEIQPNCEIGDNTRIQSHTFICEGTKIGKNVFVGHGVITCNDKNPIINNNNWKLEPIIIEDDVSIGSNATILPGITIYQGSKIGAGAVVTKNIPAGETWVGNPARKLK